MGLDLQEDGTRTEKCELTSGLKAELSLPDERDREIEESSVKVVAHIEATHTFTRSLTDLANTLEAMKVAGWLTTASTTPPSESNGPAEIESSREPR
ncbi:hypothetical protein ACWFPY_00865 [Nocardia fluminea]